MKARKFSLKAELIWKTIPAKERDNLLHNVWCVKCRTAVEMVDFAGKEEHGNLILEGGCRVCGEKVCRFVESADLQRYQS